MLKSYFVDLAAFNSWAEQMLINWLCHINDEQWDLANVSSFVSIRQTAVLIASAKKIWTDYWVREACPVYLSATFDGMRNELLSIWRAVSESLENYFKIHPDGNLDKLASFVYPNGNFGHLPYYQTFAHVVNHSNYHRGQLINAPAASRI
jgi:uncharacterized damage-inducible protein DinB